MRAQAGYHFTSESVTEGHPDKIADRVSDTILDATLAQDPKSRVACETFVTTGLVVVGGEITTKAQIDVQTLVRNALVDIGYDSADSGFDGHTVGVLVSLDEQSNDISDGVNEGEERRRGESSDEHDLIGAGDQGMMFGYATNETAELMPLPITLAHGLTKRLADVRKDSIIDYLRPDGKAQVTVLYDENDQPVEVVTVVVSTQHKRLSDDAAAQLDQIRRDVITHVIKPVLGEWWNDEIEIHVNPSGAFVIGGPHADAGLTGRKIIVDTYGGSARHGGGAFSGKDATKVDRSAAYAARWVAKNVVKAELAKRCEIQVSYAIGRARPVSLYVDTHGTGKVSDELLSEAVTRIFDLRPAAIIEQLELQKPIFAQTSSYGHFGRPDLNLPWERTDRVEELKAAVEELRAEQRSGDQVVSC